MSSNLPEVYDVLLLRAVVILVLDHVGIPAKKPAVSVALYWNQFKILHPVDLHFSVAVVGHEADSRVAVVQHRANTAVTDRAVTACKHTSLSYQLKTF